jgi:hypothetical protein
MSGDRQEAAARNVCTRDKRNREEVCVTWGGPERPARATARVDAPTVAAAVLDFVGRYREKGEKYEP